MDEFLQKYTKALLFIPPSIFTIIMCVTFGWHHIGMFLFYLFAWSILTTLLMLIYWYFDSKARSFKSKLISSEEEKKLVNRILTCLKLNQQQWKDFSIEEKRSYVDLYLKQEEIKRDLAKEKINKLPYHQKNTYDKLNVEKRGLKKK